jgi:hypothetical protein
MTRTANIGHWFLVASLFAEAMAFCYLTGVEEALGRTFGFVRAYPLQFWFLVLGSFCLSLLGFFAAAVVLLRRPWSGRVVAVFCCGAIIFAVSRASLAEGSDWYFVSGLCVLPVAALGYTVFNWISLRANPRASEA